MAFLEVGGEKIVHFVAPDLETKKIAVQRWTAEGGLEVLGTIPGKSYTGIFVLPNWYYYTLGDETLRFDLRVFE